MLAAGLLAVMQFRWLRSQAMKGYKGENMDEGWRYIDYEAEGVDKDWARAWGRYLSGGRPKCPLANILYRTKGPVAIYKGHPRYRNVAFDIVKESAGRRHLLHGYFDWSANNIEAIRGRIDAAKYILGNLYAIVWTLDGKKMSLPFDSAEILQKKRILLEEPRPKPLGGLEDASRFQGIVFRNNLRRSEVEIPGLDFQDAQRVGSYLIRRLKHSYRDGYNDDDSIWSDKCPVFPAELAIEAKNPDSPLHHLFDWTNGIPDQFRDIVLRIDKMMRDAVTVYYDELGYPTRRTLFHQADRAVEPLVSSGCKTKGYYHIKNCYIGSGRW